MHAQSQTSRPNIVFVFADDWGWGDLGCYGHPHVKTPNLDRLAASGQLFTQFYVCSGVCSPSRAAVMTGQFPARLGIHGHLATHEQNHRRGMPNFLEPSQHTITRLLQASGYKVGHYGKWHLGHGDGAPEPFAYGIDACRINVGNGPPLGFSDLDPGEIRRRSSELIVNESIAFIERHQNQPFFLQAWLNDTHAVLDPSLEMMEPYRHFGPASDEMNERHKGAMQVYYATVTNADRHIGRLMDCLDELALADNTIFIFSADNGPEDIHIRNASHSGVGSPGPFRGRKRSLYEGGVRTPFILRWPNGGGRAGTVNDETVLCAVDLLPTFCQLAQVELPNDIKLDGEDMSSVFCGDATADTPRQTPLMWEWRFGIAGHPINRSPILAIREANWKLLVNPDASRIELYDIPNDVMELNNVADKHADIVRDLSAKVKAWAGTLPEGPVDSSAGGNDYRWPKSVVKRD